MQYRCPACEIALFSDKYNAVYFLKSDRYPSNAKSYKCGKCGVMTERVYYHAWDVGDLCEECHRELKHLNMECRIEDDGFVDLLSPEELEPLWRIKMKSGLSILEQILEAIEDYAAKHFISTEEKQMPPINNRIRRFGY
jgi:hypothetical protein